MSRVTTLNRILLILALLGVLIIIANYLHIPTHPAHGTHVDAIIVLGSPALADGTPTPEQRERTLEGVREYRRGVAPHLIFSGSAVYTPFVEASVMANIARAEGVPAEAILTDARARNTIQNIFYSAELMHQHGWQTAEIVSSPSHLPRTALILTAFDREQPQLAITWSTHPAPRGEGHRWGREIIHWVEEAPYCLRLRLSGFPRSPYLPGA